MDLVVSHDFMKKLSARSSFSVLESGMVFFGFRGLLPLDLSGTDFAPSHDVRQVGFNNKHMRCTIGQWLPAEGLVALFPGSTVPDIRGVEKARKKGGIGANMLMLGHYVYDRGVHKPDADSGHRAFRQGMFFPVWRTADDLDYDLMDRLDTNGTLSDNYPWDNLHCAYADNVDLPYYSSSGCQVVAGRPSAPPNSGKPESGPWKRFIENAYGPLAKGQTRFPYMLFSGSEVGKLSISPDGPLDRSVRFGSRGEWVTKVQAALRAQDFPFLGIDEDFGRNTLEALMAFQEKQFGKGQADGVIGPNTASALGLEWPPVVFGKAKQSEQQSLPLPIPDEWEKAAVRITPGFETTGDPYLGVEGNFDGMGISCGALQWNIGQNSLQPMVRAVGEQLVLQTMPTLGGEMWKAGKAKPADGMPIVLGWQINNKLSQIARSELKALMGSATMRAEQHKRIDQVAQTSLQMASQWAKSADRTKASKREFCWFFEIVTQNGSLKGLTHEDVSDFIGNSGQKDALKLICDFLASQSGTSGHVKDANKNAASWRGVSDPLIIELLVATYLRSKTALPQWRHVVINRKGTVAVGKGWVNSSQFDFSDILD